MGLLAAGAVPWMRWVACVDRLMAWARLWQVGGVLRACCRRVLLAVIVSHAIELSVRHTCLPCSIVNDCERQIYLCIYRHIVLLIGYSLVVLQLLDLLRRGRPSSHLMLVEVQVSPRYVGYARLARGLGRLLD